MSSLLAGRLPPRVKLPPSLRAELTRAASGASLGGEGDSGRLPPPPDTAAAAAAAPAAEAPTRRRYESPVSDDESRADSPPVPSAAAPPPVSASADLDGDGEDDDDAPGDGGAGATPATAPLALDRTRLAVQALLHGCRNVNAYRPIGKIDEGTYGVVFAAEDVETGERVALKKVKMCVAGGRERVGSRPASSIPEGANSPRNALAGPS